MALEMSPTHGEIEAAAEVFRHAGLDIHLPWEGDLDDRERELFEALRDALLAAARVRATLRQELRANQTGDDHGT